ncbi:MAG: EF-P lysine aminoacylase EpmA [Oceanicoccus sp.]
MITLVALKVNDTGGWYLAGRFSHTMTNLCWQPTASIDALRARAKIIARIRDFFFRREVMEVETPLLARHSVTDPFMDILKGDNPMGTSGDYYLQTSPEYAMKRLLAAGSGPIFEITKAFRKGEQGSRHNPEFTMLEWYRPGFDHFELMTETERLVGELVHCDRPFLRMSYGEMFQQFLNINPHTIGLEELALLACKSIDLQMQSDQKDDWLNVLLTEIIEPQLGFDVPVFVYDYPASQSALAKTAIDNEGILVAQRFELYVSGVELANGYFELTDASEQEARLKSEQTRRLALGREKMDVDIYLSAAMSQGLPSCAGVALGVDRLIMLALQMKKITDVIAFPSDRA